MNDASYMQAEPKCLIYTYRLTKQKHLGCKKVRGQRLKALISSKAKKSVNESAT